MLIIYFSKLLGSSDCKMLSGTVDGLEAKSNVNFASFPNNDFNKHDCARY